MSETLAAAGALSDASRVRVVMALRQRPELCVCQIIELLKLAPATISRHMSVLKLGGLVESRKEGRWVYYRLSEAAPVRLLQWLDEELSGDERIEADRREVDVILDCELSDLCSSRKSRRDTTASG